MQCSFYSVGFVTFERRTSLVRCAAYQTVFAQKMQPGPRLNSFFAEALAPLQYSNHSVLKFVHNRRPYFVQATVESSRNFSNSKITLPVATEYFDFDDSNNRNMSSSVGCFFELQRYSTQIALDIGDSGERSRKVCGPWHWSETNGTKHPPAGNIGDGSATRLRGH